MKLFTLCCLLSLAGCSSAPSGPPKLPESASFGWKLKTTSETKAGQGWRAEYEGPGKAYVDIYRLNSPAEALDMQQRWRASAQTVTVFNGNYFVVIKWEGANRAAATALVGQIERSLK